MEQDVRNTKEFKWAQDNPELYQRTLQLQIDMAANGIAWHNPFSNECTKDFGCCTDIGNYHTRIPRVSPREVGDIPHREVPKEFQRWETIRDSLMEGGWAWHKNGDVFTIGFPTGDAISLTKTWWEQFIKFVCHLTGPADVAIIPTNLDEMVDLLIEEANKQKATDQVKERGIEHHGAGTSIRNAFNLWWDKDSGEERPPLVAWFNDNHQIYHADDMSHVISEAMKAKLNGKVYDIEVDKAWFRKHWEDQGFKDGIYTVGGKK